MHSYRLASKCPFRDTSIFLLTDLTKRSVLRQGGAARRTWYEFIFSGNEKIRETILPAKLAEKPSVETKREKKVTRK